MSNDSYLSPEWILEMFKGWFDPCPYNNNPEIDGLKIEWKDNTYVNPPYSNPKPWVEKAIEENKKGKTIAMLLRVDTSTKWFSLINENRGKILWINGRIAYMKKEYTYFKNTPCPFPVMLVIFSKHENLRLS